MDVALETFKSLKTSTNRNQLDCERIKITVAEYYNISVNQLSKKIRTTNIAMYLCKELLDLSLTKIGEEFGGKDHTSVMNAIKNVENKMKQNSDYFIAVEEIKNILKK